MKILITGVAGLVGSNLARNLMKNHAIVGIDNLIGGYRENIPAEIRFLEKRVEDIDDSDLRDTEVVVHAACTPHEGLSVFSPSLVTHNTFGISMSLLSKCISSNVGKFIFLSSMARYGTQDSWPFTEDMIPKPQDPYGIAKYAFELALKNLSDTHGLEYVILVPHNIVGPGQKYNDPFRNVAGIMINRMLQNKQPIIYGDGMQMRSFSDIRDVIEPLKRCIFTSSGNGQIINIGPDDNFISINELAARIAEIIEFDLNPIYLPARPREVRMANCSASKARLILGYKPEITLNQTLEDMIQFVRMRGPKPFDHSLPLEIVSEITPLTWRDKEFFEK